MEHDQPEFERGMPRYKLLTLKYWSLVGGTLAPLVPTAIYAYVVTRRIVGDDAGVSPAYPVVLALMMGVPPLLLIGGILSYVLPRPRSIGARFVLGAAIGATLLVIAQTDAVHC